MKLILVVALIMAVVASAIAVVRSKHATRDLFVQLERMRLEQDELRAQWGRLQLEQSTWGNHSRVERVARETLGLQIPSLDAVVIVSP